MGSQRIQHDLVTKQKQQHKDLGFIFKVFFFFFKGTIFKVFIEFVTISLLFHVFDHKACGILTPQPGIEPAPPSLEGELGKFSQALHQKS